MKYWLGMRDTDFSMTWKQDNPSIQCLCVYYITRALKNWHCTCHVSNSTGRTVTPRAGVPRVIICRCWHDKRLAIIGNVPAKDDCESKRQPFSP